MHTDSRLAHKRSARRGWRHRQPPPLCLAIKTPPAAPSTCCQVQWGANGAARMLHCRWTTIWSISAAAVAVRATRPCTWPPNLHPMLCAPVVTSCCGCKCFIHMATLHLCSRLRHKRSALPPPPAPFALPPAPPPAAGLLTRPLTRVKQLSCPTAGMRCSAANQPQVTLLCCKSTALTHVIPAGGSGSVRQELST